MWLAQTVQGAQEAVQPWTLERVYALILQCLGVISTILAILSANAHGRTKVIADELREKVSTGEKVIGVLSPAAVEHASDAQAAAIATQARAAGVEDHPAIVAVTK